MRTHIVLTVVLLATAAHAESVRGVPRILDGDTVDVAGVRVRMLGMDAPETDQVCLDGRGSLWACGVAAKKALVALSAGREWRCDLQAKRDIHHRRLGTCFVGGIDADRWMVSEGWAMSYRHYGHTYDAVEDAARTARKGLWVGAFHAPWDWRHHTCETEIHGAISVPIDAARKLCPVSEQPPQAGCIVKANFRSANGCIFHMPGDGSYYKLVMSKPGHRWYCTPQEAIAAGCRRAKQ